MSYLKLTSVESNNKHIYINFDTVEGFFWKEDEEITRVYSSADMPWSVKESPEEIMEKLLNFVY